MKEHLIEYKWIYINFTLVFLFISMLIYYEYTYPCVRGHYEKQWETIWCYSSDGSFSPCGEHAIDVYICDCRSDSIK